MEPVSLPPMEKIDMAVQVHMTDALQQAKWEHSQVWDLYVQPIGNALSNNSESLARALFREVYVTKGGGAAQRPTVPGADVVLTPALASLERDHPALIFNDQTTTIQITWTMSDRNGKTLWATTVLGEGKGPLGNFTNQNVGYDSMKNAIADAFRKSAADMSSAPLIRQYAAKLATAKEGQ
jgi:hypothetical protein